jgi:hypothetical protein
MVTIVKTANYTVTPNDADVVFGLGGASFFTFTLPDPTTLPRPFSLTVMNIDDWSTGRAKYIKFQGNTNAISRRLWPGQVMDIIIHNGAWNADWQRARLPGIDAFPSGITFKFDPSAGSDDPTLADGLSTTSGAFKSVQGGLTTFLSEFDFSGYLDGAGGGTFSAKQTQIVLQNAAAATDTQQILFSPQAFVGATGALAVTIDLNGGTLSSSVSNTMKLFRGANLSIRNGTITNANTGPSIICGIGAHLSFLDGITLGSSTSGTDLFVWGGAVVEFLNDYTIAAGSRINHILAKSNSLVIASAALTATLAGNVTFSDAVIDADNAVVDVTNVTWALASHTVTGDAFAVDGSGSILGIAAIPGTFGTWADDTVNTETIVPTTVPASPSHGWTLYCDSGDGNKLKAKASTGTIITLGTP